MAGSHDRLRLCGFTLIEVMVALGVLGMISMSIWAATSQTARTREVVETAQDKHHQVNVAMEMVTRDLSCAFLSKHRGPLEPTHDTVFIARDHGEEDTVDFAAFTHQRRYFDINESDQAEIGYFLAEDPNISGQRNLVRRESSTLDQEPLEGGQLLVLVEDVVAFDLQYFDLIMNEWQDEWDTTQAAGEGSILPTQVRIRLVVRDRLGEEVPYGTQVPIHLRTPILNKGFQPGPPILVN